MIYKNILVTIDGSPTAKLALQEAIKIVKDQPASFLRVVHVVDAFFINWSEQPINPKDVVDVMMASGKEVIKSAEADIHQAGVKNYETKLLELRNAGHRID